MKAGFKLRNFVPKSDDLHHLVQRSELESSAVTAGEDDSSVTDGQAKKPTQAEEDQSYAKSSLSVRMDQEQGTHKVVGVQWNVYKDEFCFGIGEVAHTMEDLKLW